MANEFVEQGEALESLFRELRESRSLALECLSKDALDCIGFSRLMSITRGDVAATADETHHLSDCYRCQRLMERARTYFSSQPEESVTAAVMESTTKPLFDRFIDGFHRMSDWVDKQTDFRRSVPCSFTFASVGGYVLGDSTQTFTCNLMYLLEELGVADYFETFKLVCETGNGTTVSAVLIPRKSVSGESGIEVALYLFVPQEPRHRSAKRGGPPAPLMLLLKPFDHVTRTPKLEISAMGDPAAFAGSLEIRIQEAVAPSEEE